MVAVRQRGLYSLHQPNAAAVRPPSQTTYLSAASVACLGIFVEGLKKFQMKTKLHSNNAPFHPYTSPMRGLSHLILKIMIACSQGQVVLLPFLRVDKLRKREVE